MPMETNPPKEQPLGVSFVRNLEMLKFELNNINQGIPSYLLGRRISGTFGAARYRMVEEVGGKTEVDGPDSDAEHSVNSFTDEDDDAKTLIQCPSCDFEIVLPSVSRLEIDPQNMLCPVCDETLGDAIKFAQKLNSQKRTLKSDKSSVSSGDSVVIEKEVPARGSKHEPVPDPLLSPFIRNVSVPISSGVHPGEGSSSNALDISNTKGSGTDAPTDSDDENIEEKRLRASFVQELVLSTLI